MPAVKRNRVMDGNYVINIGRQIGSGGKSIGEIVSHRLGIGLYDKELINLAAEESGFATELFEHADEYRSRGAFSSLIGYLRVPFAGDDGGVTDVLSGDALFKIQSDVIRKIADRESCIFVGRCADYILRDFPRTVNVFITADSEDRQARISSRLGVSPQEALAVMQRGDSRRASYYNYYSSRKWGAAETYHLCVNSSVMGIEGTAEMIIDFARRKLHL